MPSRIIRDGLNDSKAFNSLSDEAAIFYFRLMLIVDDYGRFEADPELIRARCFARQLDRWSLTRVRQCLSDVGQARTESNGLPLVLIYARDGKEYLEISNFGQRTRGRSKYPEPTARDTVTVLRAVDGQCQADDGQSPPNAYCVLRIAEASAEAAPRAPVPIRSEPPERKPSPDYHERYEALYRNHPKAGFKSEGQLLYLEILSSSVNTETVADAIDKSHAGWREFWEANPAEYRPGIGQWFSDGYYLRRPKARDSPAGRLTPSQAALKRAREQEGPNAQS